MESEEEKMQQEAEDQLREIDEKFVARHRTGTLGWIHDFLQLRKRYPEIMGKYEVFIDSLNNLNKDLHEGAFETWEDYASYRKLVDFLWIIALNDLEWFKR